MSIEGEDGHQIITLKLYTPLLHLSSVKLRARRALSIFRDAPLRTRRALPVQMFMAITPFWFSMEHLWIVIAPFWLSIDDLNIICESSKRFNQKSGNIWLIHTYYIFLRYLAEASPLMMQKGMCRSTRQLRKWDSAVSASSREKQKETKFCHISNHKINFHVISIQTHGSIFWDILHSQGKGPMEYY